MILLRGFFYYTARKSKYTRLYLYRCKLILAATYLRRVFVDGRSFAAGAPALTHVYTVGACGTKPRRGSPAALPGAGVWRHAWGDGAHCPSAAQRGHGARCPSIFSAAAQRQTTKFGSPAKRFFPSASPPICKIPQQRKKLDFKNSNFPAF